MSGDVRSRFATLPIPQIAYDAALVAVFALRMIPDAPTNLCLLNSP